MILAVSGKGGVGKTLVSSLIIKYLLENTNYKILAIDADPDSNLPESLGLEYEKTIGDIREEITEDKVPAGMTLQEYFEYKLMSVLVETDRLDLLVMGRSEGPGCYCAINHILRQAIDTLAKNYDYVIIDCEAGLEHLSRRTTQDVDVMLIVSDLSKKGINTARRIRELANELHISFKEIYLIINMYNNEKIDFEEVNGIKVIGKIPYDPLVKEYDIKGIPLIKIPKDSPSYVAIKEICKKIFK